MRISDQSGCSFSDGSLIAAMLGGLLEGALDREGLWRVLEEQQRYRPRRTNPIFGLGGFGPGTIWGVDAAVWVAGLVAVAVVVFALAGVSE